MAIANDQLVETHALTANTGTDLLHSRFAPPSSGNWLSEATYGETAASIGLETLHSPLPPSIPILPFLTMAQTTSCFSLKAAAQLDNIVFYTGPPCKKKKQRLMCDRDLPDLEKLLAQYASGEASDVSHHHTANLVGSTEAVTPPNVSMAAPTDAYSMFDPTLSELPDLPEDGGALQFRGNTGNDEGAWSPSELLSHWDGSGDSHYPTRHSGVREIEADAARMVDSSSDPVVGKALLLTLPHTPEPSVTASHHENDPESTTRGVGVTDPCPTAAEAVSLLPPLPQDTGMCQRPSPGRRQEAALLANYDREDVSVSLRPPTRAVDQTPTAPFEDSHQLEALCQPVAVPGLPCTVALTEPVGSARPYSPLTDRAQHDPRCSSPTEVVPVAEQVSPTTAPSSDMLDARVPTGSAETALFRPPRVSAMPMQCTEIASSVSSDGDDIGPTVRRRLYRRRPRRDSVSTTSAEPTQVAPIRSRSRRVERRATLDTPPRCGSSCEPVIEALAKRTGRQEKRALNADSDTHGCCEENTVGHADRADAVDRPDRAGGRPDGTISGRSEVDSATPGRLGRVRPATVLLLVSLADSRLQVARATSAPSGLEQASPRAPEEAGDFT
ncbi:hypothetical protein LTR48_005433 [Friedmanniomyces endolithicus]|uniref:Uncharacterized protein n=1 Tax=Rachicladosporium monterosium TaxID=1507873 RepID=A0ABR0L240_9PEZI|nr:hypothetical protein LTR48_005433 [Friedmanniomyces endolithicus]KAK5142318.1 hypothetical protein LTR32_005310 [Rachicladosporium monterosium]